MSGDERPLWPPSRPELLFFQGGGSIIWKRSPVTAGENIRPATALQESCGRVLVAKEVIQ